MSQSQTAGCCLHERRPFLLASDCVKWKHSHPLFCSLPSFLCLLKSPLLPSTKKKITPITLSILCSHFFPLLLSLPSPLPDFTFFYFSPLPDVFPTRGCTFCKSFAIFNKDWLDRTETEQKASDEATSEPGVPNRYKILFICKVCKPKQTLEMTSLPTGMLGTFQLVLQLRKCKHYWGRIMPLIISVSCRLKCCIRRKKQTQKKKTQGLFLFCCCKHILLKIIA